MKFINRYKRLYGHIVIETVIRGDVYSVVFEGQELTEVNKELVMMSLSLIRSNPIACKMYDGSYKAVYYSNVVSEQTARRIIRLAYE